MHSNPYARICVKLLCVAEWKTHSVVIIYTKENHKGLNFAKHTKILNKPTRTSFSRSNSLHTPTAITQPAWRKCHTAITHMYAFNTRRTQDTHTYITHEGGKLWKKKKRNIPVWQDKHTVWVCRVEAINYPHQNQNLQKLHRSTCQ